MPTKSLKIDNARYVVTLDGQRRIIQNGSVLIEDGRISRVGKAAELMGARADRVIDARHLLVTPGFYNGHMHISYAHAVRGIFPDDAGSPLAHVFKLQMAMTEEEEYYTTLLGLVELLKNGTVCFVDPGSTKFPDACLQAYQDAGMTTEAIGELEKAVTLGPSFADLRTRLGVLYRDAGDLKRAREQFEAAKATNPNYLHARILLGVLHLSAGDNERAIAELDGVVAADPDNKAALMYLRIARAPRSSRPPPNAE